MTDKQLYEGLRIAKKLLKKDSEQRMDIAHSLEYQTAFNSIEAMGFYLSRIKVIGSIEKVIKLAEKQLQPIDMFEQIENQNSKNNTI